MNHNNSRQMDPSTLRTTFNLFRPGRNRDPGLAGLPDEIEVSAAFLFFLPNKPPNSPFFFLLSGVGGGFDNPLLEDELVLAAMPCMGLDSDAL